MKKRIFLLAASLIFSAYVLAPLCWMVSSSFQAESEITSKPPHWVPHQPTVENFAAIFTSEHKEVTYENRKQGDTATGGFIPSTAKNLLPSMWNSFLVAILVVVLNLLVSIPAAYAMAKIRFIGLHLLHAHYARHSGYRAGGSLFSFCSKTGLAGQHFLIGNYLPCDYRSF